jgi:hypothetical protein
MSDERPNEDALIEEAHIAIREGMERARELLCEAKFVIGQDEEPKVEPPNPSSSRAVPS